MTVSVERGFDLGVAEAFGDFERWAAHLDEETCVAVAQIVDTDAVDTCAFDPDIHVAGDYRFGNVKNAVGWMRFALAKQLADFMEEKWGERDEAVASFGFRGGDDILTLKAAIAFGDGDGSGLKVKVCACEGKKLADSHAGPVQHLKDGMVEWGIYISNEMHVFIFGPKAHLAGIAAAHRSGFAARVGFEVIVALGVAEDGDELVVHGFEIGWSVISLHHFVLPLADVWGSDLVHGFVSEIRKKLCLKNFSFYIDGTLFEAM